MFPALGHLYDFFFVIEISLRKRMTRAKSSDPVITQSYDSAIDAEAENNFFFEDDFFFSNDEKKIFFVERKGTFFIVFAMDGQTSKRNKSLSLGRSEESEKEEDGVRTSASRPEPG